MRLRGVQNYRFAPSTCAAHTCHAWLVRLTRARRQWFGRRTAQVLLADFWYFSSQKSTIKEKLLYLKKTPHPSAYGCHLLPQSRRRRPRLLRKSVNSPLEKAGKNPCFRQRVYWIHARRTFICGRAGNACTNLLGYLA